MVLTFEELAKEYDLEDQLAAYAGADASHDYNLTVYEPNGSETTFSMDDFDRELMNDGQVGNFHLRSTYEPIDIQQYACDPSSSQPSSSPMPASSALRAPRTARTDYYKNQRNLKKTANSDISRSPQAISLGHAPPVVHSVGLLPISQLPLEQQRIFAYGGYFNAVQSRCFPTVYEKGCNLVVSAPTGAGKTAIFELAICRLLSTATSGSFKVIYMSPTKALCSERRRDWEAKFTSLGLKCGELTGDTDQAHIASIKESDIIITTPEKWDSMTRKWHDHQRLMELVRLFLIDEVHILKENRGAVLEAVVSRMKTIGRDVRFVALSATIPNAEDVAAWLSKKEGTSMISAALEVFGDEYRPVKLQRHVYGYLQKSNDFTFEYMLDHKLFEIIEKHADGKPVIIFCGTRRGCSNAAKMLANTCTSSSSQKRSWKSPDKHHSFQDKELENYVQCGVAYHHAGLSAVDRSLVEKVYLAGDITVVCCTSTLAVGINLPARLVVLKNTVGWVEGKTREYIDLEVMQMIGRAGRPQFDDVGVAVILTSQDKKRRYENLLSGLGKIESCLHLNLVEHLNAEIGLGTINSIPSAIKWLRSTFFYVRLCRLPSYYKIDGINTSGNIDQDMEELCLHAVRLLQDATIIESYGDCLKTTAAGNAMAKYYIKFGTMKLVVALKSKATLFEIIELVSKAEEFHEFRIKSGEKTFYKAINKNSAMRFPLKEDIKETWHKIFILIGYELGGLEKPNYDGSHKLISTFDTERLNVMQYMQRIVKCIVEHKVTVNDGFSVHTALEFSRSIRARCWDDSSLVLKQLDKIGPAGVKRLVSYGIHNFSDLRHTDAQKIEMAMSRNLPFGATILKDFAGVPSFTLAITKLSHRVEEHAVAVRLLVRVDLSNEHVAREWHRTMLFASITTERSDGYLLDFRRLPIYKVKDTPDFNLRVDLTQPDHKIFLQVACEEIAGTNKSIEFDAELAPSLFSNMVRTRSPEQRAGPAKRQDTDTFADEELDALFNEAELPEIEGSATRPTRRPSEIRQIPETPKRLSNGNWKCNHKCKDKLACKHLCCREGMDRPPKNKKHSVDVNDAQASKESALQTRIRFPASKSSDEEDSRAKSKSKKSRLDILDPRTLQKERLEVAVIDLSGTNDTAPSPKLTNEGLFHQLHQLHMKTDNASTVIKTIKSRPKFLDPQYSSPRSNINGTSSSSGAVFDHFSDEAPMRNGGGNSSVIIDGWDEGINAISTDPTNVTTEETNDGALLDKRQTNEQHSPILQWTPINVPAYDAESSPMPADIERINDAPASTNFQLYNTESSKKQTANSQESATDTAAREFAEPICQKIPPTIRAEVQGSRKGFSSIENLFAGSLFAGSISNAWARR